MAENTNRSGGGSRFGIRRRFGLAAAILLGLLVGIGLVVSTQVNGMVLSIRRVLEEQREAGHARDIVHSLRLLQTHLALHDLARLAAEDARLIVMRQYLAEARQALASLEAGPSGRDPSLEDHTRKEARMYGSLDRSLAELEHGLVDGPSAVESIPSVAAAEHMAEVLQAEVRDAAAASSADLRERGGRLRLAVAGITLVALSVLGLITWSIRRSIVAPIERLREGTARIGAGELDHRVPIRSPDEIGELAQDFNHMAGEIQAMRRGLEQRVEERTREFLRAARLAGLGTMAAGIAHEINNPLASIASCAEGLERRLASGKVTPGEQREYLQTMAREAYRAHEITSRLLEFAHAGPRTTSRFAVQDLMREIGLLLEHQLRDEKVRLETSCDPDLPPMESDPSECKQVILNLVHNAIDASPAGGTVSVRCRHETGEAVLEVEDHGPGIPPEDLERIFDPFFTTKPPGKGTGLGLAIVHRIVLDHHGRIEVENTGQGALFRVRIPLAQGERRA